MEPPSQTNVSLAPNKTIVGVCLGYDCVNSSFHPRSSSSRFDSVERPTIFAMIMKKYTSLEQRSECGIRD